MPSEVRRSITVKLMATSAELEMRPVSRIMGWIPSKLTEPEFGTQPSNGVCRFTHPQATGTTPEEQISEWISLLQSKKQELTQLHSLGYHVELDCCIVGYGAIGLTLSPALLTDLGALRISLSVKGYFADHDD